MFIAVVLGVLAGFTLFVLPQAKRKNVLCLLLVGALLFVLVGCKTPEEDPSNSTAGQSIPSKPTDATTPSTSVPTQPTEPEVKELGMIYNLVSGRPYKFGMLQEKLDNTVYYLTGTMDGAYVGTTTQIQDAADFYVERIGANYHLYTIRDNVRYYIDVSFQDDRVVWSFDTKYAASFLYKYGTLVIDVGEEEYLFGVRAETTYTTVGLCKASESNYVCHFYGEVTDETDWLQGNWERVTRTEWEMEGFTVADLSTWGMTFNPDGSGISGGYEWTSWDVETGGPAKEWTVPGMGFPSEYFSYALEGDVLYITYLGSDVEDMGVYARTYQVIREEEGFMTLKSLTDDQKIRLINTEYAQTLEELCKAFGVDYTLPKN